MSIEKLNPYLNFNGNAAQAIALYERALGARTESVMRFGDMPGAKIPAGQEGRIMHARLHIGEGVIMISDTMAGQPVATGGNVQVCLHFRDTAELAERFDALAAGGTVLLPPHETFWAATFGMLTDAFGVRWMFNCDKPAAR